MTLRVSPNSVWRQRVPLENLFKEKTPITHRRGIGKLEAKLARNYCHQHLVTRYRNNDPEEITETIFIGSLQELNETVLAVVGENRSGEIPEYPRGLVCFDSHDKGFFNLVSIDIEMSLF